MPVTVLRFGMIALAVASRPMFVPPATDGDGERGKIHRRNKDLLVNPKKLKQVVEYAKREIDS